jgi:hypothetical protein
MKNDTGSTTVGKTYYGVKETVTLGGDTLELISGDAGKPDYTEEFTGQADMFTHWFESEAEARQFYAERRRELNPEPAPDEDSEEYAWAEHYRSLQADADIKHAIDHGYAAFGYAW